jgi:iron complex outermembrane recepter protein
LEGLVGGERAAHAGGLHAAHIGDAVDQLLARLLDIGVERGREVAGGPDLITQVPNMTFTKTNFSSYSIQLRGIGTQAISATTDPAVAVAFNNTPFVRNHFFEQEFYDLQRVEVLRGPQGTLYGRNATAGVVNIISAKPAFRYEAKLSGDVANYNSTRLEGMVNIPLVEDKVALRLAGAWTKRDGYDTNQITGNPIDGRDLWSTRVSLRVAPTDGIDANLIWEHFEENDDRLRSGKQLCKKDVVTEVGGVQTNFNGSGVGGGFTGSQAVFSQGCKPSSLYSPDSFETPNGFAVPYYYPLGAIFLPVRTDGADPYVSNFQSRDLRVIESTVDPKYRAKSDLGELQISIGVADGLTLTSETAYMADDLFSMQDFNRFNTAPGAWNPNPNYVAQGILSPEGVFCDPQIGCSDRLVAIDVSSAKSRHFSQEFRLASDYDGPFNFSLGANFLRYDTEDKYYVFINALTLYAAVHNYVFSGNQVDPYVSGVYSGSSCLSNGPRPPRVNGFEGVEQCQYIEPNPIGALKDEGHNYFLSRNPYKLISYAMFGEAYYNITDNLKLTAGLRWTVDKKEAPRIPSWVLGGDSVGYAVQEVVRQEWREPTGRLTLDWKPDLSFTDQTLLYASFAHGYKAGGANPPPAGFVVRGVGDTADIKLAQSATKPRTFDPEFVNAFEVGSKNTLADGKLTLNLAAFYYDYKDYQISYIVDRSAVNLNFDSRVWGLELEADWRPLENLRLGFKGGYENTKVADGEKAIDLMDRTAGHAGWLLIRPFPTNSSSCILPAYLFVGTGDIHQVGNQSGGGDGPCELAYTLHVDPIAFDPSNPQPYIPNPPGPNYSSAGNGYYFPNYPGFDPLAGTPGDPYTGQNTFNGVDYGPVPNNGEGFYKDLSGHELPNAPHFTATITADYTLPLPNDWLMTLHTDLYYQSEAWTRIFNDPGYDKLKAYSNINLAAIFTNEDAGWKVMAYVKNVLDRDSITGAFLNSDDTGLTTNVFLTEPRLYGIRVTKDWTGGSLLDGLGARHDGPYPFTVELEGQVQRHDAPNETIVPSFLDDSFAPEIDPRADQEQNLDWGNGGGAKFTYAAGNSWKVSLGARFGKTNLGRRNTRFENQGVKSCTFGLYFCQQDNTGGYSGQGVYNLRYDFSKSEVAEREEHTIVDFAVGRDMGMGGFDASTFSGGLRYAQFKSSTVVDMYGQVDWAAPLDAFYGKYGASHNRYEAKLDADRQFKGAGPVVSWDASTRLLGGDQAGHLDLDWSLSGGVLFGKQTTRVSGKEIAAYYYQTGKYFTNPTTPVTGPTTTPVNIRRSSSVTVPVVDLGLGLSYKIDRFNVGAGYRWERYYNVIDGGYQEHKSYDRTIDGPYFKIAVGFGG